MMRPAAARQLRPRALARSALNLPRNDAGCSGAAERSVGAAARYLLRGGVLPAFFRASSSSPLAIFAMCAMAPPTAAYTCLTARLWQPLLDVAGQEAGEHLLRMQVDPVLPCCISDPLTPAARPSRAADGRLTPAARPSRAADGPRTARRASQIAHGVRPQPNLPAGSRFARRRAGVDEPAALPPVRARHAAPPHPVAEAKRSGKFGHLA